MPLSPRFPSLLTGALLGAGAAALWTDGGAFGLLLGAALGAAGDAAAAGLAAAERTPRDRSIAYALVAQAVLVLIPLLAVLGAVPSQGAAQGTLHAAELLLIPLGAASAAGLRYRAGRNDPAPEPRVRTGPEPRADRWLWTAGALLLVLAVGYADFRLPAPFSLDFLYLIPVFAVTWAAGGRGGVVLAVLSAEVHGLAQGLAYPGELPLGLAAMDSLLIAGGLAGEALLLGALMSGLERETAAARTDTLTGLLSRKAYLERLDEETARAGRYGHPLSMAYLDLDGFKGVNDSHGHAAGDEVLRIVAGVLRTALRAHDTPARLGGDEFAVLLPETDAEAAVRVMERLRHEIEDRMRAFEWPVTCSVGVVTSLNPSVSGDDLVRRADALMYEVKHGGKNALRQAVVG